MCNRKLIVAVVAIVCVATMLAQTTVTLPRAARPAASTSGLVLVFVPSTGQAVLASLGTGLTLQQVGSGYVLAASTPPVSEAIERVVAFDPAPGPPTCDFSIPDAPAPGTVLDVSWQGLMMAESQDYTVSADGKTVSFMRYDSLPNPPRCPSNKDIVRIKYRTLVIPR